jgi:hypothetical protein
MRLHRERWGEGWQPTKSRPIHWSESFWPPKLRHPSTTGIYIKRLLILAPNCAFHYNACKEHEDFTSENTNSVWKWDLCSSLSEAVAILPGRPVGQWKLGQNQPRTAPIDLYRLATYHWQLGDAKHSSGINFRPVMTSQRLEWRFQLSAFCIFDFRCTQRTVGVHNAERGGVWTVFHKPGEPQGKSSTPLSGHQLTLCWYTRNSFSWERSFISGEQGTLLGVHGGHQDTPTKKRLRPKTFFLLLQTEFHTIFVHKGTILL